jgi:hypothetical protein
VPNCIHVGLVGHVLFQVRHTEERQLQELGKHTGIPAKELEEDDHKNTGWAPDFQLDETGEVKVEAVLNLRLLADGL